MKKFLVVGGAGYIGGVCVEKLVEQGDRVIVLDNLKTGHKENIHPEAIFYQGDKGDSGESVKEPAKYFENNFCQGVSLLDSMRRNGVDKIIFSSTAAVFGNPKMVPITEEAEKAPINPYGESKYFFEQAIKRYSEAYGLSYTIFRYFNACGATERSKEEHVNESHLIPLIFQAVKGERPSISVFGTDYETPDGTCIRDYIHVEDLISAHLQAIENMKLSPQNEFNLGNGSGYSVKEVIAAVEKITEKKVPVIFSERREGDPARLIASAEKAKRELEWVPKYPKIEQIIESAWKAEE
jgi:UDP-glucose 4-epimerase